MTQPVDPEELGSARDGVRQALGSAFAEKATDAFCLSHRRRTARAGFGLEALASAAAAGPPGATIVEFDGTPQAAAAPADWAQVGVAAGMLRAALPGDGTVRASGVLRQAYVASARNACYNLLTPVYDEIERLSGGPLQPGPEVGGASQIPTLVTQICWLNRSLRTWAGPESLADVATDRRVTGIDVPRRLMPDAPRRRRAAAAPQRPANQVAIGLPAFLRDNPATGKGVTVAVIDTEVAIPPSLAGRVVHRRNYTPEAWGNPGAHGTAVAGIIGAADGVHGIAPDVMIYNYKVLTPNRFINSDDFGGTLAIQQALEDNCDIANCSWGDGPVGAALSRGARAVDAASALGMVTVKSAGNNGEDGPGSMSAPADSLTAIVVGATGIDGAAVQPYSSRGPAGARLGPDVVAPGGTQLVQIACALVGGGFGDAGAGTSFAAPHVTGVLALLLERSPDMLPAELADWVRKHAHPLAGFGTADQGEGLLTPA